MPLDVDSLTEQRLASRPSNNVEAKSLEARLVQIASIFLFAALAVILYLPLISHASWMIFVQDDFLYYLKVAQNIAHGRGSTFNSIVETNGYQPLWLLVLVLISWLTTSSQSILAFLAATTFLASLSTFLLTSKLLRLTGARPALIFALSAYITIYSTTLFFYGMEVTLAVPILLAVLNVLFHVSWLVRSSRHTFAFGLLLSAMVLARIDTLILGALILIAILLSRSLRSLLRPGLLAGLALGLLPLPFYFGLNHIFFHTWLPVSGMAKELKLSRTPSLEPWRVFFHPLAAVYLVILVMAFVLLLVLRRRLRPITQAVLCPILLFPFAYYLILSFVSDWTLWGWYMYPLRTAMCASFFIFCTWQPTRKFLERPLVTGSLALVVFGSLFLLRWTRQQTDIYAASVELQEFAATHPGIYAMGDRAGRFAYLTDRPVIQVEGLMMDRDYLALIKAQTPLRTALSRYNARYYVATAYTPFTGCFHASEPAKAGPDSAKMRAVFCEKPETTYLHNGIETLVYDLSKP